MKWVTDRLKERGYSKGDITKIIVTYKLMGVGTFVGIW